MSPRYTPPAFISLPYHGDRRSELRRAVRFWGAVAAVVMITCVVSWVVVGLYLGAMP